MSSITTATIPSVKSSSTPSDISSNSSVNVSQTPSKSWGWKWLVVLVLFLVFVVGVLALIALYNNWYPFSETKPPLPSWLEDLLFAQSPAPAPATEETYSPSI